MRLTPTPGKDLGEWAVRYSVPEVRLSLRLGPYFSPGYFGMQSGSFCEMSSQAELLGSFHPTHFWAKPIAYVGLLQVTTIQT